MPISSVCNPKQTMKKTKEDPKTTPILVSIFATVRGKKPKNSPLSEVLDRIKGDGKLADQIKSLRATTDSEIASKKKLNLPAVTFAGTFSKRNASGLIERSGIVTLDFDHLENAKLLRVQLNSDPHCVTAFISPGGNGVKALMRIDTDLDHAAAFSSAANYVLQRYGEEIDPSGKDVSRLCFLSHDPEIRINFEATPVPQSYAEPPASVGEKEAQPKGGKSRPGDEFNVRGEARMFDLLREAGWTECGGTDKWTRPEKTAGVSATWNGEHFYVFSSNAQPFEAGKSYRPFAVYALLEHDNNFGAAAASLAAEGFGDAVTHDSEEVPKVHAYYDKERKEYLWRGPDGVWASYSCAQVVKRLRGLGYRYAPQKNSDGVQVEPLSQIDQILLHLQDHQYVDYHGKLCGRTAGFYKENGNRILVTQSPTFFEPKSGTGEVLSQFMSGLLCDHEVDHADAQWDTFHGWMQAAVLALRAGRIQQAQALAIAGPANCGKSLLQKIITELLGGRAAKAAPYMMGRTDFNGNLFEAEHLMLEDEFMSHLIKDRMALGSEIKKMTVSTGCVSCNRKQRHQIDLSAWWRVTISLNDDPESLKVLPPLDVNIEDKIILLRASRCPMPMPTNTTEETEAFWNALVADIPAYLRWLFEDFTIPEAKADPRYIVATWHHPEIRKEIEQLSPEFRLLELIDLAKIGSPREWRGTSLELETLLKEDYTIEHEVTKILGWTNACGTYLGRIAKKHPDRVTNARTGERREWIIKGKS